MNLKTVFSELADALSVDENIAQFIQDNYSDTDSFRICIGVDPDDLPETTDSATVYLLPGSRSRTRGDAYRQHNISVICFVSGKTQTDDDSENAGDGNNETVSDDETEPNDNPTSETESDEDNNIVALEVIGLLDDFTNLVEECVFKKLQSLSIAVIPLSGENDEVYYPVARSELSYSIEIPSRI